MRKTMPDLVVVAVDRGRPEVFSALGNVAGLGFRVVGLPEFYEHAFGRVPVRRMTDAWFMSILHLYQRSYSRRSKRAFDVAGALAGLLLTAPLLPADRAARARRPMARSSTGRPGSASRAGFHDPQVPDDANRRRVERRRVGAGIATPG